MRRRRVTIRVDHLRVPPHLARQGNAIQSAIRDELARALAGVAGDDLASKSVASIDAGRVPGATGSSIGSRVGEIVARRALT